MGKQEVIMKIDPYVSELLCYLYPNYLKYINSNDSCIYVKLRKKCKMDVWKVQDCFIYMLRNH